MKKQKKNTLANQIVFGIFAIIAGVIVWLLVKPHVVDGTSVYNEFLCSALRDYYSRYYDYPRNEELLAKITPMIKGHNWIKRAKIRRLRDGTYVGKGFRFTYDYNGNGEFPGILWIDRKPWIKRFGFPVIWTAFIAMVTFIITLRYRRKNGGTKIQPVEGDFNQ